MIASPTDTQIKRCIFFGWQHLGDGIFTNGEFLGYYNDSGFYKEEL